MNKNIKGKKFVNIIKLQCHVLEFSYLFRGFLSFILLISKHQNINEICVINSNLNYEVTTQNIVVKKNCQLLLDSKGFLSERE